MPNRPGASPAGSTGASLRWAGLSLGAGHDAVAMARALRPEAVIVDVTPAAGTGFGIARRLRALPAPPIVILTSSTDRTRFGSQLDGHVFITKADICSAAIARLTRSR